jgi:sister chromatid cohesion protein DCC1
MLTFGGQLSGVRLWEFDDDTLLGEVRAGRVALRGAEGDEAVLCSQTRTYAVRSAESTNALLLIAPEQPTTVCAMLSAVLEVKPCKPRLAHLFEALERTRYRGRTAEAMVDRVLLCSRAQLGRAVQCSEEELSSELARLGAVEVTGAVRLVEGDFEHRLVELALCLALEHGWHYDAVPLDEAAQLLAEECDADVTRTVLGRCGELLPGNKLKMDAKKVSLLKARVLLRSKPVWIAGEFFAALSEALPQSDYFAPLQAADCYDFAIVEEKGTLVSMRYFALDPALEERPEEAFAQLFAARATWPLEQLRPHVLPLASPAVPLDLLLLRHCYVNRMDPAHVTVSKR